MCACGLNVVSLANAGQYENTIPIQAVTSNETLSQLRYFFCLNKEKVQKAFAKFDLAIETDNDLRALAQLHDSKRDVNIFKEDFLDIANKINFSDQEKKNASCKLALTY
jgi:hypothetical protein